eukprot:839709-Pyramimonas_sp.AAC.1
MSDNWGRSFSPSKPLITRMGSFLRHPPISSADGKELLLGLYYTVRLSATQYHTVTLRSPGNAKESHASGTLLHSVTHGITL